MKTENMKARFKCYILVDILEKLALRLLNGVQSNKYKPVDYEQLKLKAQEMKFKGNNSLVKVSEIFKAI